MALPKQKVMAIVKGSKGAIKLGRLVQIKHPEVAEYYRSGKSLPEIVNELDLVRKYEFSSASVAASAVSYAIRGHNGDYGIPGYEGLITDKSELEQIAKDHNYQSGKKLQEDKKGIFKLSEKEKKKIQKKACASGGKRSVAKKAGVHGRSKKQMQIDSRKALRARGITPWIRKGEPMKEGTLCEISEIEYAYLLSQKPEYQNSSQINCIKLADEVNRMYHNDDIIRNSKSVSLALTKYRKKLVSLYIAAGTICAKRLIIYV